MNLDAVVLAGGGREEGLPEGLPNKAFLPVGGVPMVVRVLRALRATPEVARIAVVGPEGLPQEAVRLCDLPVPEQGELFENAIAGITALGSSSWVLLVASDLPLLTPQAVSSFLGACWASDAEIYYPIVPREAVETRCPGLEKTYVRLFEGTFAGGGMVLVQSGVLDRVRALVREVVEARKNPARLAALFGARYVMKYALGRLRIAEIEARAQELSGIRGRAVVCAYPELAIDVDLRRPQTLARIARMLEDGER